MLAEFGGQSGVDVGDCDFGVGIDGGEGSDGVFGAGEDDECVGCAGVVEACGEGGEG